MANTSAAKKALRTSSRRNQINNSRKSRIRSFIRKVFDLIKSGDQEQANAEFKNLQSELMRGVSKGVFSLNNASRKLSRINSKIKNISNKAKSA